MTMRTCSLLFLFAITTQASWAGAQSSVSSNAARTAGTAVIGGSVTVTQQIAVPRDSAGEFRSLNRPQMTAGPAVTVGEYYSAPWLENVGGPGGTGRIVRTTKLSSMGISEERAFFQHNENVYIVPPAGGSSAVGQRYLAFRLGNAVGVDGQVMVPTGILRIEKAGAAGDAPIARVTNQYDHVTPSDRLIALAPLGPQGTAAPAVVSNGVVSKVTWVEHGAALPTLQSYAIIDAGSAGARMGDIFTIMRPRMQAVDGTWLAEKEIARGRVVKVSAKGSTILIIKQTEPAISVGAVARLTARMP